MTPRSGAVEHSAALLAEPRMRLAAIALLASVTYQAVICYLNTRYLAASPAVVGLAELLILLAILPLLLRRVPAPVLFIGLAVAANFLFLAIVKQAVDPKALRDLLIPIMFLWLGLNFGGTNAADRVLRLIVLTVLAVGLFEYFFVDSFTAAFDILSYYANLHGEDYAPYHDDSRLFFSGIRVEGIGRTLLPDLLGNHRVSSIFLEPVSLGNFATILAAWGLAKGREQMREGVFFVMTAVMLIVLSDSRFALVTVALMAIVRLVATGNMLSLNFFAPFAAVLVTVGASLAFPGAGLEDSYLGRLARSGDELVRFDAALLLGMREGGDFLDHGYAYVFSRFGLPMALMAWASLWLLPMRDAAATRFRAFVALYIALILCVSGGSVFAMKTAALMWFLFGCGVRVARESTTLASGQGGRSHPKPLPGGVQ